MHFSISPASNTAQGVRLTKDIKLIPSRSLNDIAIKDVTGVASALADALIKSAPIIANKTLPDGALLRSVRSSGEHLMVAPNLTQSQTLTIGDSIDSSQLGPHGDFVLGILDEVMKEKIGAQRPTINVQPGCSYLLSKDQMVERSTVSSNGYDYPVRELTTAGEILIGIGQYEFTDKLSEHHILELLERSQLANPSNQRTIGELMQLANQSEMPHIPSRGIGILIDAQKQLNTKLHGSECTSMNVFWGNKNIGRYAQSRQAYSFELESQTLQHALVHRGEGRENSAIPAFVNNNMPELSMSGSSLNGFISRVLRRGFYALGNLAVIHETERTHPPDKKGIPMSEFTDSNHVFPGAVFNVIRPSQLGQKGEFDILHEQLNPNKNELTVSGAQVKTVGFLGRGTHGSYVQKATLDTDATCLIKVPSSTIGGRAAFGGLEWLSMTLARAGGLEVPNFALIDFNKATRRYLRDTGPATLEERAGDVNLAALDMKRQIFAQGSTLGQNRIKPIRMTNRHEKTTGDMQEPPGYMIERFDLPDNENELVVGVDFATLMGIDASDKFKRTYEDAAKILREHSSDFKKDGAALMQRIMGSWLLIDSDLHMKNLSVLIKSDANDLSKADVSLSPSYDILSAAGVNGLKHEMATTLNGTEAPHLDDFIDYGVQHLDMTKADIIAMAQSMAQGIMNKADAIRNCPLERRYEAPVWPQSIQSDNNLRHTMNLTLDSICANIAIKGLLPANKCESILLNIQSENPSAYSTMVAMNMDAGYRPATSQYDDLLDELDNYALDDDQDADNDFKSGPGAPFSI